MTSGVASERDSASALTGWLLSFGLMLCYLIALFYISRRFIPWIDEVQFTDPGANLYFNGRFVSTVWPHQTSNEIFLENAPLYSFLLGLWFHLVGFGVLQARALAWLFGLAGLGIGLWVVDLTRLVAPRNYPWLLALFLSSSGVSWSFWSARYDTLGLFLIALVMAGAVRPDHRLARTLGRVALFVVPFAGYHLVVVCAFILAFPVVFLRKRIGSAVSDGTWLGLGVVVLFGIYAIVADLKKFLVETFLSAHTLAGQIARGVTVDSSAFDVKLRNMLAFGYQDLSFTFLLAVVLLGWLSWPASRRRLDRADYVLLAGAVLLPLALSLLGKYPPYYSWIGHACASVLVVRLIQRTEPLTGRRTAMLGLVVLVTVSAALGVGRLAGATVGRSARPEQIASVSAAVRAAVRPGEYVYSDMSTYFAARSRARYVYAATYAQTKLLPGFPTARPITTMIVQSKDRTSVAALLGGEWRCEWRAPEPLAAGQDTLRICRRAGPAAGASLRASPPGAPRGD
jgi:hypothetical protein